MKPMVRCSGERSDIRKEGRVSPYRLQAESGYREIIDRLSQTCVRTLGFAAIVAASQIPGWPTNPDLVADGNLGGFSWALHLTGASTRANGNGLCDRARASNDHSSADRAGRRADAGDHCDGGRRTCRCAEVW